MQQVGIIWNSIYQTNIRFAADLLPSRRPPSVESEALAAQASNARIPSRMGELPMQMPNGMNIPLPGQVRNPTLQEIMKIRNHPSGKMNQATDDQIRSFIRRYQIQQLLLQQSQTTPERAGSMARAVNVPQHLLQQQQEGVRNLQQQQAQAQAQTQLQVWNSTKISLMLCGPFRARSSD
jgi:hypothetical protein